VRVQDWCACAPVLVYAHGVSVRMCAGNRALTDCVYDAHGVCVVHPGSRSARAVLVHVCASTRGTAEGIRGEETARGVRMSCMCTRTAATTARKQTRERAVVAAVRVRVHAEHVVHVHAASLSLRAEGIRGERRRTG
jgi:hypothetical protein